MAIDRYVEYRTAEGHRPHSFYYLTPFWRPAFEHCFLRDITADMVRHLLDRVARERELAPCTRHHYIVQIQAFFKFAFEDLESGSVSCQPVGAITT